MDTNISVNISDTTTNVRERIDEACGNAINPKAHKMLLHHTPLSWTVGSNACDFDLDLIPTLKRISEAVEPHSISSWNYYRAAVFESRDIRIAEPNNPAPKERQNARPSYQSASDRAAARSAETDAVFEAVLRSAQ